MPVHSMCARASPVSTSCTLSCHMLQQFIKGASLAARTHARTHARARTHTHTHTQHTRQTVMTAKPTSRTPRLTHVAGPGRGGWCALLRGETESRLPITPVHTSTQFKVHEHMLMHVILSKYLCSSARAYNTHPSTNWHLVCLLAPPAPLNLSS